MNKEIRLSDSNRGKQNSERNSRSFKLTSVTSTSAVWTSMWTRFGETAERCFGMRWIRELGGIKARAGYELARVADIFMFTESLSGWRVIAVRPCRTKVDWATEMAIVLRSRYAGTEKVILVFDNLNTHTTGAFYEVFPPDEARELARKNWFSIHAKTWKLVEYCRKRTEFADASMREESSSIGNRPMGGKLSSLTFRLDLKINRGWIFLLNRGLNPTTVGIC